MEEFDESPSKINRKPGNYKFRAAGETKSRIRKAITCMAEVKIDKIDWLWDPYIPLGRLTMLGGDPGAGKSFITTALASMLSRGDPLPGEVESPRKPMVTLMLNAEDDPSDTIKPRLNNLEADQTKIFVSSLDIVLDEEGLTTIEEMISDVGAKLVIIDPIVAFMGPKMDMNRANEVRHVMKALGRIARRKNIAIVLVRHNRKETSGVPSGKAIYSGMGSIDFTASVRSELAVNDTRHGVKFLNHIKANSGKKGPSIRYDIVSMDDGTGMLKWGEIVDTVTVMGADGKITKRFKNELGMKAWLFDLLRDGGEGGVLATEVIAKGQLAGFSQTKIEHIKKGVALSIKRKDGWYWKLDDSNRGPLVPDSEIGV